MGRVKMGFNKYKIMELRSKIQSRELVPSTEEATKQWIIMPFLIALGYDPYSADIIPEYTLDIGTKHREKVDYALQINSQPVILIECKQLNIQLSEKYISQLYRYFTVSDAHIGILTNGDDYWFFTDSKKENVMDLEPYYKLRLSEASDVDIEKLAKYSKDLIQHTDIVQVVQHERFRAECRELVHSLRTNNIPSWLLNLLAERSGMTEIDKPTLADYLYTEIKAEFNGFKAEKRVRKKDKLNSAEKENVANSSKDISNIKLNHEYVYNDFSDGTWAFHSIGYAIILGIKFDNITAKDLLIHTVEELYKSGKIDRKGLLSETQFTGTYKIDNTGDFRGAKYIDGLDLYIGTSYGMIDIIKFIERLMRFSGTPDNQILLSFKS